MLDAGTTLLLYTLIKYKIKDQKEKITMEIMTKKELVKAIAEKMGITQKDTMAVIDAMTDVVTDELLKGNAVKIPSLVTLEPQDVEARTARNPRTGESVSVDAHKKVKAKVSKTLKDKVR